MLFTISHQSIYTYSRPVALDPHTLRQKPRQDGSVILHEFSRSIYPKPGGTTDFIDLEGNPSTQVWFEELTTTLKLSVQMVVETLRSNPFDYVLTDPDILTLPVRYPQHLHPNLLPYCQPSIVPSALNELVDPIANEADGMTLPFLSLLTAALYREFAPMVRMEGAPWAPEVTLGKRQGTCRDLAVLFVEACRTKGLAARFVSGYWNGTDVDGLQHLHAWAEVFLPQAGWRGYDPSAGLAVCDQYVPLAAGLHTSSAALISGAYWGTDVTSTMESHLSVQPVESDSVNPQ